MIIEREITDVLQVTLSVFILSLILVSGNPDFNNNEMIHIGLIMIILGTFIHIILVQLDVLSLISSKYFSYFGIISTVITIIGYFLYDKSQIAGFWDDIGLSYNMIFNLSLIILFVVSLLAPGTHRSAAM